MKKIFAMALIFLSTLHYFMVHAQNNTQTKTTTLSGKVISFEESFALEGVSITVKGTSKSSGTQADGTFSIPVSPEDKVLVFRLDGYEAQEVSISSSKEYDVVLKQNSNADNSRTFLLISK